MEHWSKRLAKALKLRGWDYPELATRSGVNLENIKKYAGGHVDNPRGDAPEKIADALRVPVAWLMLNQGKMEPDHLGETADLPSIAATPPNYLPVRHLETKAGMGGGQIPEDAWGVPRYFESGLLASLRAKPDDLGSMEVEGQSMEGILFSGDQILFNRKMVNVSEPGIFVLWDGDGLVCKWVERIHRSEPPMYRIFSENARFKEYSILAEEAVIHGRVIWFARRL